MSNNSNTLLGILAGSAIGALIGVLFAPDKGSVTRERLKQEALNAKESMNNSLTDLENNIKTSLSDENTTLDDKIDAILSDASHKAEDVISSLEEKLKQLKEKNKQYQKSNS